MDEMMSDTDRLIEEARQGDQSAVDQLFIKHRDRLRTMVSLRMDRRLAGRVDPSDIVQDAMAEATRRLPEYLGREGYPFYPWIRKIAWDRMIHMHRMHVLASKRTVIREAPRTLELSDESVCLLADRLPARAASPSQQAVQKELRQAVRDAVCQLNPTDQEIIVLRNVEAMPAKEIAVTLDISEAAVRSRYRRALERLNSLLSDLKEK